MTTPNVNGGHRVAAFCNSFAIGLSQLALFKMAPDATGIEIAGYLSGGMADGVANRVDRLRAIGNGQVPRVAAGAWRILTHNA